MESWELDDVYLVVSVEEHAGVCFGELEIKKLFASEDLLHAWSVMFV